MEPGLGISVSHCASAAMASEADVQNMQARIGELERLLAEADMKVKQAAAQVIELGNPGRRGIGALTGKRSFSVLDKWSGKEGEFEPWQWKMRCFLQEEQGWGETLRLIENMREEPNEENMKEVKEKLAQGQIPGIDMNTVNEVVELMNKQLYQVLTMNLIDGALAPLKLRAEAFRTNGFACWWKMAKDNIGMTPQRLQTLAKVVLRPTRVKKMSEVSRAVDTWEAAQKEYVKFEGNGDMSDIMKITCIRGLIPEELENDVVRCSNTLKTYVEARNYIIEQAGLRKDHKTAVQNGPVPMEVDMMKKLCVMAREAPEEDFQHFMDEAGKEAKEGEGHEEPGGGPDKGDDREEDESRAKELYTFMMKNNYQAGQRKGGKGKGRFDGNCSHCGAYGHRLRECYKKDKEMDAMRAGKGGGKGAKGGYQYGGKGGYQPNPGWGNGGWHGGKGWGYQKGGWKGNGKGDSKGGKAMGLSWGGNDGYGGHGYGAGNGSAWTLCALTSVKEEVPKEEMWEHPKKVSRPGATGKVEAPPGLTRGFEVLRGEMGRDEYEEEFPVYEEGGGKERVKMPRMGNYSKGRLRRERTGEGAKGSCFMLQRAKDTKPLNPFMGPKPDSEGWVKIKGVMDSGASESVAPPSMCPHYPTVPSAGSIAGQKYLSAGEELIDNLGEQMLEIVTEEGCEGLAKYQVADVSRPLNAVSEICDAGGEQGQVVVFSKWGGEILNLDSGKRTPFGREDGVYVWEFWVKPRAPDGLPLIQSHITT